MALPSTFRERLEQMEQTRNQRLSLLQVEKKAQIGKSQVLASKLSNIGEMERRCLKIDCQIASQHLVISSLKSHLHFLDTSYNKILQQFRNLKTELDELGELEKERESYYVSQSQEMKEFRAHVESYVVNCHVEVEEFRARVNELKSSFSKLQSSLNYSNNSEIAAAETRKIGTSIREREIGYMFGFQFSEKRAVKKATSNDIGRPKSTEEKVT